MMENSLGVFVVIFYIGLVALYIYLIVIFLKACFAVIETKDQIKDMSYRDTARYLSEVRRGIISKEDQEDAEKSFK